MSTRTNAKTLVVLEPPVAPIKAEVYTSTAKPKPPLTAKEWADMDKPKVLIVGAGIGGLFLGNLLHKAKIPFLIFERAKEVKNLGTVTPFVDFITSFIHIKMKTHLLVYNY